MSVPTPGQRVVIRYSEAGQLSDALGTVVEASPEAVVVTTKRGPVTIPVAAIELVHEMPPAPTRAGKLHEIVSAEDLRRISANVWLPADTTWFHADNLRGDLQEDHTLVQTGWLLRANGGTTQRANSAMPLSSPGVPVAEALELVERWFADREQQAGFLIYSAGASNTLAAPCTELAAVFRSHGYAPGAPNLALTAATREVAGNASRPSEAALPGLEIVEHEEPHALHWAAWGYPEDHPEHAAFARLVTGADVRRFFSAIAVHPDGSRSLVGCVRLAVSQKWAVISNLVVSPALRRRGAGTALVRAAAAAAASRGFRSVLVEVDSRNEASLALMRSLGFTEHHRYWHVRKSAEVPQGVATASPAQA
ncbi:GNAT family N-acetyltransferase [Brevibacterium samyangense]|uniref:N-acetyltransferase domain-containing protein n=1 Tax=Brevibacterium samyangense TaxID=366888 RepID=A0ABP5EM47_9MICO